MFPIMTVCDLFLLLPVAIMRFNLSWQGHYDSLAVSIGLFGGKYVGLFINPATHLAPQANCFNTEVRSERNDKCCKNIKWRRFSLHKCWYDILECAKYREIVHICQVQIKGNNFRASKSMLWTGSELSGPIFFPRHRGTYLNLIIKFHISVPIFWCFYWANSQRGAQFSLIYDHRVEYVRSEGKRLFPKFACLVVRED